MSRTSLITASILVICGAATPRADDRFPAIVNESVRSECGDCHLVYQPQMLPQRSWTKLMAGLADHFGEELDLDPETALEVRQYLLDHAADRSRQKDARKFLQGLDPGDAPIRITRTPRWEKKHRKLPDRVWSDPRLEFKGDCEVCHTKADKGVYDDDEGLRVPAPNGRWRRWDDD